MKHVFILSLLAVTLFLGSCQQQSNTYTHLEAIDSLLHQELADSAYQQIIKTDTSILKSDADQAYYYLLLTWSRYVKYQPFTTDSLINQSINYYQHKKETDKLALAYAVKGEAIYEAGNITEAILCLKECEHLAQTLKDNFLDNKLYGALTMINSQQNEYALALKYGKKRLETALRSQNKSWIAGSLNQLAVCFYGLKEQDSACQYINRCIPYIKNVTDEEKVILLDNIGFFNIETHPDTALKYLHIAERIAPSADTYDNQARIYANQGQEKEADSLWTIALEKSNLKQKITIIEAILQHKNKMRCPEKETGYLKSQLLTLKDSLNRKIKETNIEKQQYHFDYLTAQHSKDQSINILEKELIGLGSFLIFLFFLFLYKRHKNKTETFKQMDALETDIKKKDEIIKNLKTVSENNQKFANELETKLNKQNTNILSGKQLFESIKQGQTTASWKKKAYIQVFSYYAVFHPSSAEDILLKHPNATPRQKIYLILKEEGWDDEKIAQCLCISKDSLRTIKYRLNKI